MFNKLKIVIIDKNYCNYLRKYDNKVPYNNNGKDLRPFIGILFMINELEYYAPLSSPKPKHFKMHNRLDFFKLDHGNLGSVNFNNMIPVSKLNYKIIDLTQSTNDIAFKKRLVLLRKQYYWLLDNFDYIKNNANKLYRLYINNKLNESMYNRCCNFKLLEEKCNEYNKIKNDRIK